MKNSEQAIEQVMSALRNSEIPSGLENRILAAAQTRASRQNESRRRQWKPLWLLALERPFATRASAAWRAAMAVTVAGLIAVALAIPVIHRHEHHPAPTGSPLSAASGATANDAYIPPHRANHPIAPSRARTYARTVRSIGSPEAPTLHEMRVVNQPAPKAPLTEQEKLLLRIARSGNPHELAMLNPAVRAKQEAAEEAEFQKFVAQSTQENE
jgi:hypothetical protein